MHLQQCWYMNLELVGDEFIRGIQSDLEPAFTLKGNIWDKHQGVK